MNDPNLYHRINIKSFVKFGKDTNEMCTMLSKAVKEWYVFEWHSQFRWARDNTQSWKQLSFKIAKTQ